MALQVSFARSRTASHPNATSSTWARYHNRFHRHYYRHHRHLVGLVKTVYLLVWHCPASGLDDRPNWALDDGYDWGSSYCVCASGVFQYLSEGDVPWAAIWVHFWFLPVMVTMPAVECCWRLPNAADRLCVPMMWEFDDHSMIMGPNSYLGRCWNLGLQTMTGRWGNWISRVSAMPPQEYSMSVASDYAVIYISAQNNTNRLATNTTIKLQFTKENNTHFAVGDFFRRDVWP